MSLSMNRWLSSAAALIVSAGALLGMGGVAHASAGDGLSPGHDNVAYIVPWDTAGYTDAYNHSSLITDASIFAYQTNSAGTLSQVQSGALDCTHDLQLQNTGMGVEAMVTNFSSAGFDQSAAEGVLNNATTRATFVGSVVGMATNPGCSNGFTFDGVELDFENLQASDRSGLTATVQALATALHNHGRYLFVSVFGKSVDYPSGFPTQQAEDYAAIGGAADEVRVQGYGNCWESGCIGGSAPGPIDPSEWVYANIDYAVAEMGADKVQLVSPLYGIDWPAGGTGTDVVWSDVVNLVNAHGGSTSWTESSGGQSVQAASYSYTASGIGHTVYFANQYTIEDKINDIADYLGITGFGLWRLGGEDPSVWTQVSNYW